MPTYLKNKLVEYRLIWVAGQLALLAVLCPVLFAQSTTTGDVTGTVTDPSGAVLSAATVQLRNTATGGVQNTATNGSGIYHIAFVPPGNYTVTASLQGFKQTTVQVAVPVGQAVTANIRLGLPTETSTVTVTEAGEGVQTQNGDITTNYNPLQIEQLPNPGNDMTSYAQTAPGVMMNTQSGYGNFSSFGLPASSNLFTLNGQNDNDPFLNLNNSGATNLLLGSNEISQVSITNNGYSGQYGGLAGAQINYITKTGTNQFHGNATWFWNGRYLNANDFFNNATGTGRPFDNANQWATDVSGPLIKNRLFFNFDYEGLRVLLPTSTEVTIPSPAFENATLTNLAAVSPGQVPFYQNIFNLYNGAKGASSATPVPGGGCQDFTGLGASGVCALQFRASPDALTHEYLYAIRVDQNISDKDQWFVRVQRDHGFQSTHIDPINPAFNLASNQPEMQGQFSETHTFGATATNNFVLSGLYYSAVFLPPSNALSTFPTTLYPVGGVPFTTLGGEDYFPNGRRVTQYQVVDDFAKTLGNHTLRLGVNYHRDDISDLDFLEFNSGLAITASMTNFYNGVLDELQQAFPSSTEQPIALWNMGAYIEDDWSVTSNFKLNLTLRIDHNSNPVCNTNCFARTLVPFTDLNHSASAPYNQAIATGLNQAYPATDDIVYQPRVGFAYSPGTSQKTVVRGGIGIFADAFPATIVDDFAENPPNYNTFYVYGANLAPGVAGSAFTQAAAANTSFRQAFSSGGTLSSITASNPLFSVPTLYSSENSIRQPRYYEWNFQIQQDLGYNVIFSANYVGNRGNFIPILNAGPNFFYPGVAGIPATVPDARFGTVTQIESAGNSSYNGVTFSLQKRMAHGFEFGANYTWSHAEDNVSNNGLEQFNLGTNSSLLHPQDPYNYLGSSWGNSDYDVRQYFSMNYVWQDAFRHMFHWGPNAVFGGWTVGGTIFYRTGLPYSVIDSGTSQALAANNYGASIFPTPLISASGVSCGAANNLNQNNPCMTAAEFGAEYTSATFGGIQGRNAFRGPGFFDTDLSITKYFTLFERLKFGIGGEAFNLFNHPNFDQPTNDIASPYFGEITRLVSVPTSILGDFLGGDASPRIIEAKLTVTF